MLRYKKLVAFFFFSLFLVTTAVVLVFKESGWILIDQLKEDRVNYQIPYSDKKVSFVTVPNWVFEEQVHDNWIALTFTNPDNPPLRLNPDEFGRASEISLIVVPTQFTTVDDFLSADALLPTLASYDADQQPVLVAGVSGVRFRYAYDTLQADATVFIYEGHLYLLKFTYEDEQLRTLDYPFYESFVMSLRVK